MQRDACAMCVLADAENTWKGGLVLLPASTSFQYILGGALCTLCNTLQVALYAKRGPRWRLLRGPVNTRHPAENCPSLEIYPLSSFMVFRPHGVPARLDYSRIGGALKLTPLTSYHHHMVPMLNSHGTRKSLLRIQNYISWVRIGRPA